MAISRADFFGDKLLRYDGDLNEKYGGLSLIDDRLVHINEITENAAQGFHVGRSGRQIPFFALKENGKVGTGCSYAHAADALLNAQIRDVPEEQRIAEFVACHSKDELYTAEDLWNWHRYLTCSCYGGGQAFLSKLGYRMEDKASVQLFIQRTQNEHGGKIIQKLIPFYFDNGSVEPLEEVSE